MGRRIKAWEVSQAEEMEAAGGEQGRRGEEVVFPDLPSPTPNTDHLKFASQHRLHEDQMVSPEKDTCDCMKAGRYFQ